MKHTAASLGIILAFTLPWVTPLAQAPPKQEAVPKAGVWEEFGKTDVRLKFKLPMESIVLRGRQLFVDNYVIEDLHGLHRVLHQPNKHKGNPVLRPSKPWEMGLENVNNNIAYTNVIFDREEGIFKVWYGIQQHGVAYATSRDGIKWEKPDLGLVESGDNKNNNLVIPAQGIDSPTVIKDTSERDPNRRYKYFAKHNTPIYGMYVGYSPDGIHWEIKAQPVLTTRNDPGLNDRPTMMHDSDQGRYIAFTKREIINPYGRGDWGMFHRSRAVSFSKNFDTWTDPLLTLHPDDLDPTDLQIYGLVGFNYESLYLGLMDMFWSGDTGPRERTIDIQLATSRDGEVWWRAGNRETFLPIGANGTWDRFRVHPANTPPIRIGEELWFYFNGAGVGRHGSRGVLPGPVPEFRKGDPWYAPGHPEDEPLKDSMQGTGMGLARLRRDGFVSLDAGPKPGRLLTKPLIFKGNNLHINVAAKPGGSVRAELFLAQPRNARYPAWTWAIDKPIPGFSLEDCTTIARDTTDIVVMWKGLGRLKQFSGQPIVIRFELVNASLYSFWIE